MVILWAHFGSSDEPHWTLFRSLGFLFNLGPNVLLFLDLKNHVGDNQFDYINFQQLFFFFLERSMPTKLIHHFGSSVLRSIVRLCSILHIRSLIKTWSLIRWKELYYLCVHFSIFIFIIALRIKILDLHDAIKSLVQLWFFFFLLPELALGVKGFHYNTLLYGLIWMQKGQSICVSCQCCASIWLSFFFSFFSEMASRNIIVDLNKGDMLDGNNYDKWYWAIIYLPNE